MRIPRWSWRYKELHLRFNSAFHLKLNSQSFLDKGQRADRIDCEGIKFVKHHNISISQFSVHRVLLYAWRNKRIRGFVWGLNEKFFIEKYFYSFLETRAAHTKKGIELKRSDCVLPDRCLFLVSLPDYSQLFMKKTR